MLDRILPTFKAQIVRQPLRQAEQRAKVQEQRARHERKVALVKQHEAAVEREDLAEAVRVAGELRSLASVWRVVQAGVVIEEETYLDMTTPPENPPTPRHRRAEYHVGLRHEIVCAYLGAGYSTREIADELNTMGIACTVDNVRSDIETIIKPATRRRGERLGRADLFDHLFPHYSAERKKRAAAKRAERLQKKSRLS